jgi:hypothetical protein
MDIFPPEAWERLGKYLERRRGQLGYGFRKRKEFAEVKGLRLSAKTLDRLERNGRPAYPDDTLALAEVIYEWEPGSIDAVLKGGEPTLTPGSVGAPRPQQWDDPVVRDIWLRPGIPVEAKLALIDEYLKQSGVDSDNGPDRERA